MRIADGDPPAEGVWLVADRQSAGRGRMGRAWQDGAGNFMGSSVVRLKPGDPPASSLALLVAVQLCEVLGDLVAALNCQIKWPNDILLGGAKVAGVLLERHGDYVVIGIGVNLCSAPVIADKATTSLSAFGANVSRDDFAQSLAASLAIALLGWRSGDWPERILTRWMALAHPIGTALSLSEGAHAGLTGTFDGLEQDGSLRLRLDDGRCMTIHAGEVRLAGT